MCKWNIKALKTGSLTDSLKSANARPIYQKVDPFDEKSYRPVSITTFIKS